MSMTLRRVQSSARSMPFTHVRTNSTRSHSSSRPVARPRLPVPELCKTLDKYLTSLEPLLLESATRDSVSFETACVQRKKWAEELKKGIGRTLQERLIALDRRSPNNWLDDNFWTKKAYLEWRAPLVINSNWWLAFHDDDLIPQEYRSPSPPPPEALAGITTWQIRRAAWILHRVLQFKDSVDFQELHPDTTRTGIWLRDSTSAMFNTARIPQPHCDIFSSSEPSSPASRQVYVNIHNFFYSFTVYHNSGDPSSSKKRLLKVLNISQQLHAIVRDVKQRLQSGEKAVPVGVLSADDRNKWADNLYYLLALSPRNQEIYDTLLKSLMGLSLEHTTHTLPPFPPTSPSTTLNSRHTYVPFSTSRPLSTHPSQSTLDSHLHAIRSTPTNVCNRFFDKPFTLIVDPSTRAGAMGEHSPCDALVPSIVAEYGIVIGVQGEGEAIFDQELDLESLPPASPESWKRLDWIVDEKVKIECEEAHKRVSQIIEDSDDSVLWYEAYGTEWIKGVAKLSPDAYVQMALQLAWYKTQGYFTATYETVLTRMFHKGRTEALRSLTKESRVWVLAMVSTQNQPDASTKYMLLRRAVQKHASLTREAATGKGIDRHLFGLRLMLRPEEQAENIHALGLFNDVLFAKSQEWKLSTSGLSAGLLFRGTGFGSTYPDGYGINYLAAPSLIKFGIESKHSCPLTSTDQFKSAVVESLREMAEIVLAAQDPAPTTPIVNEADKIKDEQTVMSRL